MNFNILKVFALKHRLKWLNEDYMIMGLTCILFKFLVHTVNEFVHMVKHISPAQDNAFFIYLTLSVMNMHVKLHPL